MHVMCMSPKMLISV